MSLPFLPLVRHLSVRLTPGLATLPITPNQITTVSLVFGLLCSICVAMGGPLWILVGAVFLVVCYVLDNCDGEIARLKNQCSHSGMRLDSFADWVIHSTFFVALGWSWARTLDAPEWLWLGGVASAGGTINYILCWVMESRDSDSAIGSSQIDSTGYETFETAVSPDTVAQWMVFTFRELFRADFCFLLLVMAVFDLTWVLLPAGAIGAQVYWALLFIRGTRGYHV